MRGISEEGIKDALIVMENNIDHPGMGQAVIAFKTLLDHCYELNGWKPIDGNTPKDRRILLFDKSRGAVIGLWFEKNWVSSMVIMHDVTHWQELPPLPKEKL